MTQNEMVGWHHWLNGHGFGWTPGVGHGQGGLACCGSWGCKESDTTEQLNWTELRDSLIPVSQSVWYTTLIKWRIKIMISSINAEKCLTKFNLIYDQKLPTKWYRGNILQHNKGHICWASLVAQMVNHLPVMRETRVWFLGREDPLEKEMAIHSSTLAWKIPWTEEPDRLQSMGSQSQTRLSDFTSLTILNLDGRRL